MEPYTGIRTGTGTDTASYTNVQKKHTNVHPIPSKYYYLKEKERQGSIYRCIYTAVLWINWMLIPLGYARQCIECRRSRRPLRNDDDHHHHRRADYDKGNEELEVVMIQALSKGYLKWRMQINQAYYVYAWFTKCVVHILYHKRVVQTYSILDIH